MRLLVSAGPTREPIDGVRFLSNRSSGRMGVALARAAVRGGHGVTVVHGPLEVPVPAEGTWVRVERAEEMLHELEGRFGECDALIMAAAVCDVRPRAPAAGKTPKDALRHIVCEENVDIVRHLGRLRSRQLIVAFSLGEDLDPVTALRKARGKGVDWIVCNAMESMGADAARFCVIDRDGNEAIALCLRDKDALAGALVDMLAARIAATT